MLVKFRVTFKEKISMRKEFQYIIYRSVYIQISIQHIKQETFSAPKPSQLALK